MARNSQTRQTERAGGRSGRMKRDRLSFEPKPEGTRGGMYRPLGDANIKRIHDAALDVLAQVGMGDPTPAVTELALQKGCSQDATGRLLFPRGLIEDIIDGAAREFTLHGQTPEHDIEVKAGHVHFATGGAAVKMLDPDTKKYRASTLEDLFDLARLCETLPNIQWFTRPVVATEIPDWRELDLNTVYACAAGTKKHLGTSVILAEHVPEIVAMLDMMLGGEGAFQKRPFLSVHATTVVSPLRFAADSSDVATEAARIGMPVHSLTGPQSGATAPAALAGTVVQTVAESLAALAAVQLVRPGHPVIVGGWSFVSDLRTGSFTGGGGEQALLSAGFSEMMNFYNLPSGSPASMTDSKLPDGQAGYEKGLTTLLTAMGGPTFVYEAAGMLGSLLGCSLEAMVIDDEMISNVRRCMRGIDVTDDKLSVDVIADAVHGAGHYLGHDQTISLMESEYLYPGIADRTSPDEWFEMGATDMRERAADRVKQVMTSQFPTHLSPDIDAAIRARFPIRLEKETLTAETNRWTVKGGPV